MSVFVWSFYIIFLVTLAGGVWASLEIKKDYLDY